MTSPLPAPRSTCRCPAALPHHCRRDSELKIKDLSPFTTPNKDFYRVDTALVVPQVGTDGWTLKVHGMVDKEIELTFDAAAARATWSSATSP